MSAEPVWCLFQVEPNKSSIVKQYFDNFVEKNITANLQLYLQRRERYLLAMKMGIDELPIHSDETWLSSDITYTLFFPQGTDDLLKSLYRGQALTQTSLSDHVVTQRFSASQILYGGLGLQRASRLPGYFGNMFIEPEAVEKTLGDVKALYGEISVEKFIERVNAIGRGGIDSNDSMITLFSLLPSTLKIAVDKGYGLLALNFPHLGTMPFPENEKYEDDI